MPNEPPADRHGHLPFTDLEGSTRLWEQFPDAMCDALGRHNKILRAAIDARRALLTEPWPLPEPLRVRMGLHTGEAELAASA